MFDTLLQAKLFNDKYFVMVGFAVHAWKKNHKHKESIMFFFTDAKLHT